MNISLRLRISSAPLLLAALGGCSSDPTGTVPGRLNALYATTTVGQTPLPVSIQFLDAKWTLLGDTVVFSSDGTVERRTAVRVDDYDEEKIFVVSRKMTYTYEVEGKKVTLTRPPCGPKEICDPVQGGDQ